MRRGILESEVTSSEPYTHHTPKRYLQTARACPVSNIDISAANADAVPTTLPPPISNNGAAVTVSTPGS